MKGSLLWKLMYLFCALAGCLAGYGVYTLTGAGDSKPNIITEDNTLVREDGNSVFFDEAAGEPKLPVITASPTVTQVPEVTGVTASAPTVTSLPEPSATPTPEAVLPPLVTWEEPVTKEPDKQQTVPDGMPSLADRWADTGVAVPDSFPSATEQEDAEETITYPTKIFGQVPVINRSDEYVSYFEFAYDLIEMLEPEVERRELSMNSLLTRFALKALFCGVEIEKLDINAPIPRRMAALCLWLAAQVLNEEGSNTLANSAGKYVTDISGCSSAEKKAVAYLYERGILKGYQIPGQKFYPDAGLKTESGTGWISGAKQCWE